MKETKTNEKLKLSINWFLIVAALAIVFPVITYLVANDLSNQRNDLDTAISLNKESISALKQIRFINTSYKFPNKKDCWLMLPSKSPTDVCNADNSFNNGYYTISSNQLGFGYRISFLGSSIEQSKLKPVVFATNATSNTQQINIDDVDTSVNNINDSVNYYRFIKLEKDSKDPSNIIHVTAITRWGNNDNFSENQLQTELTNISLKQKSND